MDNYQTQCWNTQQPNGGTTTLEQCQTNGGTTTFFVYSSPPKPVWGRPIYRNNVARPRGVHDYYNIMWDSHVRRGDPLRKEKELQKMVKCLKKNKKTKAQKVQLTDHNRDITTPPPVDGRKHFDVQTDNYLEDLEADVVEYDVKTQTEALHELPVAPWFTPAKMGEDKSTEIQPGDLFDFDLEVRPIVETLVGKVVEQALLEVLEEDELQSLIHQQNEFEERRRLEQLRLFRLQEREQRVAVEKERLFLTLKDELKYETEAQERIGANAFSALYLTRVTGSAVAALRSDGFLSAKSIITSVFVPWINCEIEHLLAKENMARSILDDIIRHTMMKREAEFAAGLWTAPVSRNGEYGGEDEDNYLRGE